MAEYKNLYPKKQDLKEDKEFDVLLAEFLKVMRNFFFFFKINKRKIKKNC